MLSILQKRHTTIKFKEERCQLCWERLNWCALLSGFSMEKLQVAFVIALYKFIDNVLIIISGGEIIFYAKNE